MGEERNGSVRPLTEDDVRQWVGDGALGRARSYVRDQRVVYPRREGTLLRAACHGSLPTPYDVEVKLGPRGIEGAYCTCPVGESGRCKHVAAVLLTWLQRPQEFTSVEDLVQRLEARPASELTALMLRMIRRHPDLRELLDEPACGTPGAPPDDRLIERRILQAFVRGEYEGWREGETVAGDLADLLDQARTCLAHDDPRSAVAIYRALCVQVMDRYTQVDDEGQHLASVFVLSVEGLAECLPYITDPTERSALFRHLLDVLIWNAREVDLGLEDTVRDALLEHATPEERPWIAGLAWEKMPGGASDDLGWARKSLGRLMLDLGGETMSDEEYLNVCREADLLEERIARLLSLGRTEEAVQVAAAAEDYRLLRAADLLTQAGHGDTAQAIVMDRLALVQENRMSNWAEPLLKWLKEQARVGNDPERARDLSRALFWRAPSLERYSDLRALSEPLGTWPEERASLMERLVAERGRSLAMRIALNEGQVDEALQYATAVPFPKAAREYQEYEATARAVEHTHPREAIRIYVAFAEALIRDRSRPSYTAAAECLARAKKLYARLGEPHALDSYVAELRASNRRLRALQEELKDAGL